MSKNHLYALMGMGWNVLGGYTGQISLGHAVYFGTGAYTSTCLYLWFGISPWLGMCCGVLFAVTVSQVIGYPCFKLAGHYFAIATICVGEITRHFFLNWDLVGAATGLEIPTNYSFVNFQFVSKGPYYYIIFFFLVTAVFATTLIERCRLGYYFRAIKMDQDAAQAIGINPAMYKMIAIAISAAMTALAGVFYAQYIMYIDPESVYPGQLSIIMCLIAVLGGTDSKWGPLVGAVILIPASETTRAYFAGSGQGIDLILYGALIMIIAAFQPQGIMGVLNRVTRVSGT
jgi:branched-chain amino acid transport system permease protein